MVPAPGFWEQSFLYLRPSTAHALPSLASISCGRYSFSKSLSLARSLLLFLSPLTCHIFPGVSLLNMSSSVLTATTDPPRWAPLPLVPPPTKKSER